MIIVMSTFSKSLFPSTLKRKVSNSSGLKSDLEKLFVTD